MTYTNKADQAASSRRHYLRNTAKMKARAHARNIIARAERKTYIDSLKSKPCADCGHSFPPYCMDFDHVTGEKKFDISSAARHDIPLERLEEELKKCELVCAICHRIRTHNRNA